MYSTLPSDPSLRLVLAVASYYYYYLQVAAAADAEDLYAAVERVEAQPVICSPPSTDNLFDARPARIELSPETDRPSRFRVGERSWESTNPTLGEILPAIDETKKLLRTPQEGQA